MADWHDNSRYPPRGSYSSSRPYSSQPSSHRSRRGDPEYISRYDYRPPRTERRHSFPPSAFVEEEADALRKEHNPAESPASAVDDEGAQFRGDVNQVPLLVPVPENNPERRFVLLPKSASAPTSEAAVADSEATLVGNDNGPNGSCEKTSANGGEYEANTCRKFTVPRIDSDSTASSSATSSGATKVAAAAGAAGLAAAAAAAASKASSDVKNGPSLERRKSRNDLPRIETDVDHGRRSVRRPRSATHSDHKSRDRSRHGDHDRSGSRDNDFLSPDIIKHATKGRDRAYFDVKKSSVDSPSGRWTSGGRGGAPDDRRSQDRSDKHASSTESYHRRRAPSSYEPETPSRRPSIRQSSHDETRPSPRGSRSSLSPLDKNRKNQSPPRTDRRDISPREQGDRDRQKPSRRDSVYKKRRDSPQRTDDGNSSDERAKSTFSSTPLRRQHSDQRRPAHRDDDTFTSASAVNTETHRPTVPGSLGGGGGGGRYNTVSGATTIPNPRQSQAHVPLVVGSVPVDMFNSSASSTSRTYPERRRRRDSSSSTSSSSESQLRASDGDRPRGPRPRSRVPSIVHNAASDLNSRASPIQPPLQSRAATLPMPIPVSHTAPIPIPARGSGSLRSHGGNYYGPRRSPASMQRVQSSQSAVPRSSDFFDSNSTNAPAPHSYHAPAFFVNIPSARQGDRQPAEERRLPEEGPQPRPVPPVDPPSAPERALDRMPDLSLIPNYRHYCEDIYNKRLQGIPECPRQDFSAKYNDWRTLTPFTNFYICPSCYEAAFARSPYRYEFVPSAVYNRHERVRCMFGSMHWFQVAYFITKNLQLPSLNLLRTMFGRDEKLPVPCLGSKRWTTDWFSIIDPVTSLPVPNFSVCEQCVTAIETLFPRLKGVFQRTQYGRNTTEHCALYFDPDRKRLWRYIGVLESANEAAIAVNSPYADAKTVVDRILNINEIPECFRDIPRRNRRWYWMRSIPDFIVCEECFEEVVLPNVNSYRGVAGDFFKEPKELPIAQCYLYSPRMRDIFMRACQQNDKLFLQQKLEERMGVADDLTDRLDQMARDNVPEAESKKLIDEWKKWE